MAILTILGAAYGLADVTQQVHDLVQNDYLNISASNTTFGDTWPNQTKSLVIVYQYDNQPPQVVSVAEGGTATFTDYHQTTPWNPPPFDQLAVLGAAYGLQDVTATLQGLVSSNALDIAAENDTFVDGWHSVLKTLVVVYQIHGLTLTRIVQEHSRLATLPLTILGATWGPEDVTAQIAAHVDAFQELHIPAGNVIFDDLWVGHHKSLVVVYQYGNEQPQTAIAEEGTSLAITYAPQPAFQPSSNSAVLQVLGAAYGLANVTNTVSSMVQGDRLFTPVNDTVLGQQGGWPEPDLKTLTVVYQYGGGPAEVACNQQNTNLQILPSQNYALQLTNSASVSCTPPSFGTGDLTIEAWVQTTKAGPILTLQRKPTYGPNPPPGENLALGVNSGGDLLWSMAMFNQSTGALVGLQSLPPTTSTVLINGEWHHIAVVRSGSTFLAYVDGALVRTFDQRLGVIDLSGAEVLHIGSALPSTTALVPALGEAFTGLIDEVRLWTVARSQAAIEDGMHHQLTDQEQGLVAHWTFDDQSLQDTSPAGRTLTPSGAVLYAPSAIDIEPAGSPYIITQAQLMEDYLPDPQNQGQFNPINGYRVQVAARDATGNPMPTNITIWAADSDYPAQVHFFDGFNAAVTDQTSTARVTNAHGEISFVIDSAAGGNPLVCPPIKIHASFMAPQERLVISPDRYVHTTLAGITADQLAGRSPLPSGKTAALPSASTQSNQQLAVSATAINQVMSAAVEHTLQPERPLVRKRDAPIDLPLPEPYAPGYEDIFTFVTPYDFQSNAQATHFLPTDQSVTRILVPENMDAPHWHFDWVNAQVTPISLDERQQLVGNLTVTHLDQFTQQFNNNAAVTLSSQQLLNIAQAQDSPASRQKRWIGSDFLGGVASATQIVLTTVESTLEDVEETVATVVITVINAAGQAFDAALQTVEDAVNFAVAIFQKIGAAVSDVVKFVTALFDWDDILVTQQAIGAVMQQVPALITGSLTSIQGKIHGALTDLESFFETSCDQILDALGDATYNGTTAPAKNSPPPNIQSKYLTSLYADNLAAAPDSGTGDGVDPAVALQLDGAWSQSFPQSKFDGLQTSLNVPLLKNFFTSPEALLGSTLVDLVSILKAAITTFIELVRDGVDAVFSVLISIVDEIFGLLTTPIVIPYVTDFYKQVVLRKASGTASVLGQFNMLSLLSLGAAILVTPALKLALGRTGPLFSDADLANLDDPQWSGYTAAGAWLQPILGSADAASSRQLRALAATDEPSLWQIITWSMAGAYAVCTAIWGVTCVVEDSLELIGLRKTVIGLGKLASQFGTIITGFPVFTQPVQNGGPQPFDSGILTATVIIYVGGMLAFLSNVEAMKDEVYAELGDAIFTGLYGVVQIFAYGYIILRGLYLKPQLSALYNAELALGEAFEWVPQLGKLDPETKPLVPFVEGCAYALVAYLTAEQTIMSIVFRN